MSTNHGAQRPPSNFHCDICNKDYARFPEFAAHEKSYEHNHTKRRKDLERMTTSKALSGARKDPQLRVLGADSSSSSDKKVKKVAGFTAVGAAAREERAEDDGVSKGFRMSLAGTGAAARSRGDDGAGLLGKVHVAPSVGDGVKAYDPWKPTGCGPDCPCLSAGA